MVDSNYSKFSHTSQLTLEFPDRERAQALLIEAFVWLEEGVSIVPAQPKSKEVWLHWRDYEAAPPADATVRKWFSNGRMNMAVICGTGGLLVLDFDDRARFDIFRKDAGELASTYQENTSRGVHLFYKVDQPTTRSFSECDALGTGHLCHVAPSIHPSGHVYASPDPLAPIRRVRALDLFSLLSPLPLPARPVSMETPGQERQEKDDLISRIRQAYPLLAYAQTLTELRSSPGDQRWWRGKCPLHQEKEPSFWVDAQRGTWGCFVATCPGARGGDVLNLYALKNGIDVREAIRRLAQELPV